MRPPGQFSQEGEDGWIEAYFGSRVGSFLDLGAHDGQSNSNTRALALRGWGGLCVEASPHVFPLLQQCYPNSPVHCLLAAVVPKVSGVVTLLESPDQVSTVSPEHAEKWRKACGAEFAPIEVPGMSVADILDRYGKMWDLVSIDVEGISAEVCLAFPWGEMPTSMVVVEHDDRFAELQERLGRVGFRTVGMNSTNLGMAR